MSAGVDNRPLERLLKALPSAIRRLFTRVLQPEASWVRRPLGAIMVVGGLCGFLPILGFWMLPVGLILIGEDIPVVKRLTLRALGALQGWWDGLRGRERT
jgi:hypothetical protein